ncbi:MAG TPA: hypothetical protein DEP42_05505 [Ruminococcaceae bacterium]|nr:hypothetical protein [Oscillospiraceae bacterium]
MGIALVRTLILYIVVITAVRIMGKRQIGELQPSELVVAILISDLASVPMQDPAIPLSNGIIPILTLISCEIALSGLTLISSRLRRVVTGRPSILIQDGQINQAEMRRLRFTLDDLMEELRLCGYMGIDEVAIAVMETNGQLSVFPTKAKTPVTAEMLGVKCPASGGLPTTLICDGKLFLDSLQAAGKDMDWLNATLSSQEVRISDVFLMTVDNLDKTLIVKKDNPALADNQAAS